jgi:NADH-quinone oxidoreductase subunit L
MELLRQQFPPNDFALLAIVLLAPLIGAIVNGLFGKRLGKDAVRTMALAVMGASFAASVVTFLAVVSFRSAADEHLRLVWQAWQWFEFTHKTGSIPIDVTFSADALSATMMLIVTGVGFLIHLYSTAYMADDPGFYRFFAYLNLFIFSMLVLILGDNLAVLFVGWEGVGLCSYLLIGFWFTDEKKAAAGKKAFITNRIGDFGLLVAMAILLFHAHSLDWATLEKGAFGLTQEVRMWPPSESFIRAIPLGEYLQPDEPFRVSIATLVCFFLFLGCAGKSAQIPLYVWLPDAMAGPTPVSALIHAATMVTAGVYLVARMSFLFVLSPAAMALVAGTGALTALLAASIAFAQTDLKKVLAYSTVSQLGFMFVGVGMGAFAAGFFHVITHAFFKGCLFLCAGSVIHAMHVRVHDEVGSQDMRRMGGLRKYMPVTHMTYLISCLAIAGAPFLSGFWSKDEIMYKAFTLRIAAANPEMWVPPVWFGRAIYAICAVAALGTAFYMFRSYFLTFWGDFKGWRIVKGWKAPAHHGHDHDHHDHHEAGEIEGPTPHESPLPMTVPLVILAGLAAVGGFVYAEPLHLTALYDFWSPVFASAAPRITNLDPEHALMWPLLGVGTVIFFAGAGAAYWVYVLQRGAPAAQFVARAPGLHRLVLNKWKVDELYDATVIGMVDAMGETAAQFDKWVIDGIIAKVTSAVTKVLGVLLRSMQTGRVQVYAAAMVIGVAAIGLFVLSPHADARADTSALFGRGELTLEAAPGHGYSYRWTDATAEPGGDFTATASHTVSLRQCETKSVRLEVQNLFGRTTDETFTYCREMRPGCCLPVGELPAVPDAIPGFPGLPPGLPGSEPIEPGVHDAGVIDRILRPRAPQGTGAPQRPPPDRAPAPGGER